MEPILKDKQSDKPLITFAVCLGLAQLLPLYTQPILIFYNDAVAILGVIIAVALIGNGKNLNVQIPWIAALPLSLAVLIIMQIIFGIVRIDSDVIYPIAYFLIAAIAVLLGASVAAQKQGSTRICITLTYTYLSVGLLSVAIAFLQFFGMETNIPFVLQLEHSASMAPRPYANIGQPNQLALLLCLSIASTWWLYQARRLRIATAIGITLIMLCGLTLTQSRTGWIIVPVFSALLLFYQKKVGFRKVSAWLIGGFVLSYALMVVTLPAIASFLMNLSTPSAAERVAAGASSERLVFFELAWKISALHPWFGAGWGEFSSQQQILAASHAPSIHSNHAHNIVLNFAAELGWPVTLLVFGILSYWLFTSCLRRKISPEIGFATLCLMAVLMHSMVEFPLWYAYVLLPFALLVGMVHHEQFGSRVLSVSRTYSAGVFFLMCALFIGTAIDYRSVVIAFREQALESAGWTRVGGAVNHRSDFTISAQYHDHLEFSKTEAREEMPPEKIAFMERVAQRFGYLPNLRRIALIYTLNDQPEKAVDKLLAAKQLFGCGYVELHQEWGQRAEKESEKFRKVFMRLPAPASSFCK